MDSSENSHLLLTPTSYLGRFLKLLRTSISHNTIVGITLFGVFLFSLYLIQFSTPDLAGNDGYYHIRFAYLMRTEGLKPDFPWLPLTILNSGEFYDHHFLYHVALIPFTFGDLIIGAKWASIFFASIAFLSVWWLLQGQRVPYAALWALGLLVISAAFLYRMNMPRAQSLSLAILVLGLNFLLHKKYKFLLPLSFIYVWTYDGFPLILILTGVYIVSAWMIDRKLNLLPLYYVVGGVSLGLLINPYFPHNVIFSFRHTLPKLISATSVRVGNEWYPYNTGQLLENSLLALIVFMSGIVALGLRSQRMDARTATALFMTFISGLLLFQARRFIEYFPPFALIFAAFAWTPLIVDWTSNGSMRNQSELQSVNSKWVNRFRGASKTWLPAAAVVLIMLVGMWSTLRDTQTSMKDSKPADRFAGASTWLHQNTSEGARVFQTDWDDFPRLFFYNTWNTYLIGLDPTYLQIKDRELYELWVDITKGKVEKPARVIYERFAAEYILTDLAHDDFIDQAELDQGLKVVYQDEEAIIYRVIPDNLEIN
jgi:hypothetical protein